MALRPFAFGIMAQGKGSKLQPQLVAVLPIKGDGKLVEEAIKASYSEFDVTPWGGLEIKDGDETVIWVGIRKGWVVLAPTGPLLDSAYRYLVPRARKVPAAGLRAQLRYKEVVALLKPLVIRHWGQMKRWLGSPGGFGKLFTELVPQLERVADYLASIDAARLEITAGANDWQWTARVTSRRSRVVRRVAACRVRSASSPAAAAARRA